MMEDQKRLNMYMCLSCGEEYRCDLNDDCRDCYKVCPEDPVFVDVGFCPYCWSGRKKIEVEIL